jgi:hypothetical protein
VARISTVTFPRVIFELFTVTVRVPGAKVAGRELLSVFEPRLTATLIEARSESLKRTFTPLLMAVVRTDRIVGLTVSRAVGTGAGVTGGAAVPVGVAAGVPGVGTGVSGVAVAVAVAVGVGVGVGVGVAVGVAVAVGTPVPTMTLPTISGCSSQRNVNVPSAGNVYA